MVARRLLVFLLAGVSLSLGPSASHGASPVPEDGRLAFAATFGNRLLSMNADGSGAAVLSYAQDVSPAWSPDGSTLAVSSLDSGDGDLFLLSPDARERKQLTSSDDRDEDPAWAPCGCVLAFDRTSDGDSAIYVVGSDGSNPHVLTDAPGCDEHPTYSPDGTKIAFASCRSGVEQIYVMNADGSDVKRLTRDTGDDRDPAWSPDGTQIAFDSFRDGNRQIYLVGVDGSDAVDFSGGSDDMYPAWAPTGRALAFEAVALDNLVIVMSTDYSSVLTIAKGAGPPAWQPTPAVEPDCTNNGTPSDDVLIGGAGKDILCGGAGNDHLNGGPDSDVLRGGEGDDVLDARDGVPDVVDGGPGHDTALVDSYDLVTHVEDVRYAEPRNIARGRPVSASFWWADSPPEFAVDGQGATGLWWGSEYAPQWIEVSLGQPSTIRRIELTVAQLPAGDTVHVVKGRDVKGNLHLLRVIARRTADNDVIVLKPKRAWHGIIAVRVTTVDSPSWVAWKEIRILR